MSGRRAALWPASTGTFLPLEARDELVMSTFQFSQTLGRATLMLGKINRALVADGNPNPIRAAVMGGLAGQAVRANVVF
jgi:hypothetical protein